MNLNLQKTISLLKEYVNKKAATKPDHFLCKTESLSSRPKGEISTIQILRKLKGSLT